MDNLSASAPDADAPGRQVRFFRDGRPVTDAELPLQRAVAENAVIAPMELEVLLPSGRRWFAEASGAPVHDAQGNVIGGIAVTVDITERKQTEAALHAARKGAERYAADIEAVMNAVPAAVFITHDVECRHMFGNRVTQELLGLPANANFSKSARIHERPTNFVAMKNGLEIPAYQLPVQVAARGQEVRNHEFDLVVEDGTVRTLLGDAVPLLNDSGQPYGAIGAFIDITARKWAEAALRLSEERYRLLAETMLQGVVHQDATGKIIAMNPSAERILGKGPAEFQGHTSVDEEYHTLREDGTPFPGLEHPSMVALRTGQPLADVVMGVFNPREEAYRWVNISAVPVHRPGETQVCEVYTVFEDITERKRAEEALRESEERFRLFMDNSPTLAWVKDEQGRHVYLSKTYEDRFGVRLEEWRGKTDAELWPAETAEEFRKNDRAVLEARQPLEVTEETVSPDGSRSYWLNSKFLFRDAAGNRYVAGIGLDITERKRAEVALRRLNDELEQGMHRLSEANRELKARTQENEAFVYSVSHDLRSPLVNLEGFSKELSRAMQSLRADLVESDLPQPVRDRELGILDGPMAKATHFIQTAVTRLSGIIDALLRLSRAGRVVYQRRCVDVQAIVTRIIDSLRGTAEERGATIETGDLPAALGDPAAVEQIFANLIGNALNYLDRKRPGRIEVGSLGPEQDNAGAGLRTYYVRDNGLGITEAGRAKVFQPFQRLYPQAAPGEGMGLAIVHRVVERHGGRIWFESVANQGSTFFVALPAFPDEESPASPIPPACSETGNQPT